MKYLFAVSALAAVLFSACTKEKIVERIVEVEKRVEVVKKVTDTIYLEKIIKDTIVTVKKDTIIKEITVRDTLFASFSPHLPEDVKQFLLTDKERFKGWVKECWQTAGEGGGGLLNAYYGNISPSFANKVSFIFYSFQDGGNVVKPTLFRRYDIKTREMTYTIYSANGLQSGFFQLPFDFYYNSYLVGSYLRKNYEKL